jgi:hypothetical protein
VQIGAPFGCAAAIKQTRTASLLSITVSVAVARGATGRGTGTDKQKNIKKTYWEGIFHYTAPFLSNKQLYLSISVCVLVSPSLSLPLLFFFVAFRFIRHPFSLT